MMEAMELPDLFDVSNEQPESLTQIVEQYAELLDVGARMVIRFVPSF